MDCFTCKNKYSGSKERQDLLFKQKNCKKIAPQPSLKYKPEHSMSGSAVILYSTCPANFKNIGTTILINHYSKYKTGIMPYSGGIMEQPAKFVEVMDLVQNLIEELETKKEITAKRFNSK